MTKTMLQRLDDLVRWTGVPAIAAHEPRRRPLRLVPLLALAIATLGFVALLVRQHNYFGYALLMLGFATANFIPAFGPVAPFAGLHRPDERERDLRRSAFLVGFAAVGVAGWLGLWLLVALAVLQQLPVERVIQEMTALAFYLATLYGAVPTLWASWRLRPLPEED